MKNLSVFLCSLALVLAMVGMADAALIDRGGGLIYDDVLDITWLQDANYGAESSYDNGPNTTDGVMTWDNAVAWADNLEYYDSVRDVTWDDWRLPQALPVDGLAYDYDWSFDGSTDYGWNNSAPGSAYPGSTGSEMAYMYYINLGNLGYYDINGNQAQTGWGFSNTSFFINLYPDDYWSGTDYGGNTHRAWYFVFFSGLQADVNMDDTDYAWAVRDGDVAAVPIPSAIWLLGSGLIGLVGFRRRILKE